MDEWYDLMVVQRMFYAETSLFEEGCVLTQEAGEPKFRNLGKKRGLTKVWLAFCSHRSVG